MNTVFPLVFNNVLYVCRYTAPQGIFFDDLGWLCCIRNDCKMTTIMVVYRPFWYKIVVFIERSVSRPVYPVGSLLHNRIPLEGDAFTWYAVHYNKYVTAAATADCTVCRTRFAKENKYPATVVVNECSPSLFRYFTASDKSSACSNIIFFFEILQIFFYAVRRHTIATAAAAAATVARSIAFGTYLRSEVYVKKKKKKNIYNK